MIAISYKCSLIFLISIYSCSDITHNPEEKSDIAVVTGKVMLEDQGLSGVIVKITTGQNLYAFTDNLGNFTIRNAPLGKNTIFVYHTLENYKLIEMQSNIFISEGSTDLGIVDFSNPPQAYEIDTSRVSMISIPISWSKFNGEEFLEYNVYRYESPGFDNSKGTLVYSSKSVIDTSCIDNSFSYDSYYYYRVYVHTLGGKKIGSNLINVRSPEKINYIVNGDFEKATNGKFPDFFTQLTTGNPSFNYFHIDNSTSKRGSKSLRIYFVDSLSFPHPGQVSGSFLSQKLFTNNMQKGIYYELSFWTKSEIGRWQINLYSNDDPLNQLVNYTIPSNKHEWTLRKFPFIIDSDIKSIHIRLFAGDGFHTNGNISGWIDDIQITKFLN
jgi:hypothetical protein